MVQVIKYISKKAFLSKLDTYFHSYIPSKYTRFMIWQN